MERTWAFLRRLIVPAMLMLVAALVTVPWASWVVHLAYEHEIDDRAEGLIQRIKSLMNAAHGWTSEQRMLDSVWTQEQGEPSVQAICILDPVRGINPYRYRDASIPIPATIEQAESMLYSDAGSCRKIELDGGRAIYVDLSRRELNQHLWRTSYRKLLHNVIGLTVTGFVIISSAAILAYQLWGRSLRQRRRALMEQQGMMAERVLTAAVLAHEIRNPLAALRFQLHSLRRNASDLTRVTSTANTIDSELMRIQQLVQNYLAHEKAQSMEVESVDLGHAAQGLHTLMDELLRESGSRLTIVEEQRGVVVSCDPHGLRQVLINLVINAQQAMGHGGTITVSIGREEPYGTIAVSDTGPGIPPEMKDRLFKPFATSKEDGSGIGLALVKRFVDNFGGRVAAESEPGKGATFRLRLPLAEALGAQDQRAEPGSTIEGLIS